MTCPPVLIANAVKSQLDTALAADAFSMSFATRVGFVVEEKLTANAIKTPLVDIVIPVNASIDLDGRFSYKHENTITIGLRQKLGAGRARDDGSMDVEQVTPILNLFYELLTYFMPDTTHGDGRLLDDVPTATLGAKIEIVKLWDPVTMETAKQYTGMFRVPFNYVEAGG